MYDPLSKNVYSTLTLEPLCFVSADQSAVSYSETRAYLRFEHGSAVHRVGRRSPLSLLSFALNFCKLKMSEFESRDQRRVRVLVCVTHLPGGCVLRAPVTP